MVVKENKSTTWNILCVIEYSLSLCVTVFSLCFVISWGSVIRISITINVRNPSSIGGGFCCCCFGFGSGYCTLNENTESIWLISWKQRRTLDHKKIGKSVRFHNDLVQKLAHVKDVKYAKETHIWHDKVIKERGLGCCFL